MCIFTAFPLGRLWAGIPSSNLFRDASSSRIGLEDLESIIISADADLPINRGARVIKWTLDVCVVREQSVVVERRWRASAEMKFLPSPVHHPSTFSPILLSSSTPIYVSTHQYCLAADGRRDVASLTRVTDTLSRD